MKRIPRRVPARLTVALVSTCAFPIAALAQEAPSPAAEANAPGLQDIVVTARRTSERLQTTPIAVTAFQAKDLEARSAIRLDEATQYVPNVELSGGAGDAGGAGFASAYIRGVGQRDYSNATDPGVGIYVDNVYLGRSIGAVLDLPDIERLEVLRGPQGTLFGKNTIGGAILISTRDARHESEGAATLTYGTDNRFNVEGRGEIALSPSTSLLGAIAYRRQDGFVYRPNARDKIGAEDSFVGRLRLQAQLTDRITLRLSGDYSNIGGTNQRIYPLIDPSFSPAATLYNALVAPVTGQPISSGFQAPNIDTNFGTGPMSNRFEGWGVSARFDAELGFGTLRSITAYRGFTSRLNNEQDGQPAEIGRVQYYDRQRQVSQEFNLLGNAFSNRLDWLIGLYYAYEDASSVQNIDLFQGLYQAVNTLPAPLIPSGPLVDCALTPMFCFGGAGNPLNAFLDFRIDNIFGTKTNSYAAFAEVTLHLTSKWSIIAGGRYTRDEKDFNAALLKPVSGVPLVPPTQVRKNWDAFTPRVILRYQPNDNAQIYASYSEGFKSGGFNSRASSVDAVRTPFNPERVSSVEAGAKLEFFNRRLRLNVAGFTYSYRDIQLNAAGVSSDGFTPIEIIANVGRARINGFELEGTAKPVEPLLLNASIGYTDAYYTSLGATTLDATINSKLPRTPEWTANVGAQLTLPMGRGELVSRIDYAYRSRYFNDPANTPVIASASADLLGTRVTYTPSGKRFSVAIYGKNLLNDRFLVNGFNSLAAGGLTVGTPNEPREVGGTIGIKF